MGGTTQNSCDNCHSDSAVAAAMTPPMKFADVSRLPADTETADGNCPFVDFTLRNQHHTTNSISIKLKTGDRYFVVELIKLSSY